MAKVGRRYSRVAKGVDVVYKKFEVRILERREFSSRRSTHYFKPHVEIHYLINPIYL
jgi:hypothetical protein